MTVSIARDGELLGEFPAETLPLRARRGDLRPTDHFWFEGMEDWQPLLGYLGEEAWRPLPAREPAPPVPAVLLKEPDPARRPPRALLAAALGLLLLLIVGYLFRHPAAPPPPPAQPLPSDLVRTNVSVRDKATAELVARLQRLPVAAQAPSFIYYSGMGVTVAPPPEALSAIIRGSENVVDPESKTQTVRADFSVVAEYRHGEWHFKRYEEVRTDLLTQTTSTIERDDQYPIPPAIVSLMGLKTEGD